MRKKRLRDLSIVQNNPNSEEGNSEQQTIIGSSNVLETLDEPAEFQIESGGTRRGRGRTLLKDLYDLNPVKLFGHYSTKGQMLPINYESWRNMPDSNKNQALDNIKDRERVGTSSRQKQKFRHTAGSRSFACVAEAEKSRLVKKLDAFSFLTSRIGRKMDLQ
ncbi:Putative zinc finger and SCAN domain-containing protein 5D [Gossypium arboreum]|uniref:Putative zinc finger and SCAN domain-containing protein 5D n=1 Tax=Gossypium arboreum TaxID=29729 RepID=A0A0B0NFG3_GOSAR|nr:Putative zinc finger and SCAN domain-containing protein 5D [Gossypium arboreum]